MNIIVTKEMEYGNPHQPTEKWALSQEIRECKRIESSEKENHWGRQSRTLSRKLMKTDRIG